MSFTRTYLPVVTPTLIASAFASILLGVFSSAAVAGSWNIGAETKIQVQGICAGAGGHYVAESAAGGYGCEGPGKAWTIVCDIKHLCVIGDGAVLTNASLPGAYGSSGNGMVTVSGPTTVSTSGGTTTGGSSGSGGCVCTIIGGGNTGGGTHPIMPPPGSVAPGTVGGTTGKAH